MKQYIVKIKVEGMDINQSISDEDDMGLLIEIFDKITKSAKKVVDENNPTK